MNAGTTLGRKVVAIKEIKDSSCNQERVLDYSPLQKVESSADLETKEFDEMNSIQVISFQGGDAGASKLNFHYSIM